MIIQDLLISVDGFLLLRRVPCRGFGWEEAVKKSVSISCGWFFKSQVKLLLTPCCMSPRNFYNIFNSRTRYRAADFNHITSG